MSWNYRIIAHPDGDELFYMIHEVHYDKDGNPRSYSKDAATIGGSDCSVINWILSEIKECLDKPIIHVDYFKRHNEPPTQDMAQPNTLPE
jgi:hypothetical protein